MIENNKINEASEEQLLGVYLNSRGINPKFVTKDTKISHAKSAEFAKWKVDHQNDRRFTEEEIKENDTSEKEEMVQAQLHFIKYACEEILDYIDKGGEVEEWYQVKIAKSFSEFESLHSFMEGEARRLGLKEESEQIDELAPETLASYVLKTTSKDPKRAEPRKKAMGKLAKIMAKRSFSEAKTTQGTALDKFRQAAADRARKHDDIEREMKARHAAGKEDMKGSIDRLQAHMNKEETEQIDELKKSTVFSWLKQQPVVPEKKPGMSRKDHNKKIKSHSKSWNRALDRLAGYKPTSEETENVSEVFSTGVQGHVSQAALDSIKNKRNVKVNLGTPSYNPKPKTLAKKPSKKASFISRLLNKEDTYQDSYAATQTTGMEIVDLPADEKYNKRKEMSKSARMIKSLYKKKGMKEGIDGQSGGGIMYDKEKTDKLETPYGKKPSMVKADKKMTISDKEPQAAAVLTGGKTLTGQDRDTLEIDPVMRKPGPPLDQNKKT